MKKFFHYFAQTYGTPAERTPLEIASSEYTQAQRDRLRYEAEAEEAQARVVTIKARENRLRADLQRLSNDANVPGIPNLQRVV